MKTIEKKWMKKEERDRQREAERERDREGRKNAMSQKEATEGR